MTTKDRALRVNYEEIAPKYDVRYPDPAAADKRGQAQLELARGLKARAILEVGCGTCHWLSGLESTGAAVYGLDFSQGMLAKARNQLKVNRLTRGSALNLPYAANSFDLVYCVDALHHFGDARRFLAQAYRALRPGGKLAIFGNDPHSGEVVWYGYEYFEGVLDTDLKRFSPYALLGQWMNELGFAGVNSEVVDNLNQPHRGREILQDPFLKKDASSQFALMSDQAYQDGLRKIKALLNQAERTGEEIVFESRWPVRMLSGRK
jgi:ubiquinone/menaquinone biosynthesis C-methylase UbiE